MKTILNNEQQKVNVSTKIFDYLKSQYHAGFWAIMIKVNGQPHMIPTDQFATNE